MPVAVGRFIRLSTDSTVAEVAYTVTDAWQGRGVGTLLMQALVSAAGALRVTAFTATVLAENQPSLRLLQKAGRVSRREANGTEVELDVELSVLPAPTKRRGPPNSAQVTTISVFALRSGHDRLDQVDESRPGRAV